VIEVTGLRTLALIERFQAGLKGRMGPEREGRSAIQVRRARPGSVWRTGRSRRRRAGGGSTRAAAGPAGSIGAIAGQATPAVLRPGVAVGFGFEYVEFMLLTVPLYGWRR
jgi:hypothetical protein